MLMIFTKTGFLLLFLWKNRLKNPHLRLQIRKWNYLFADIYDDVAVKKL